MAACVQLVDVGSSYCKDPTPADSPAELCLITARALHASQHELSGPHLTMSCLLLFCLLLPPAQGVL